MVGYRLGRNGFAPPISASVQVDAAGAFHAHSSLHVYPVNRGGWLVADARLDNRDEIIEKLPIPAAQTKNMVDTALLAQAYDVWGTDVGSYLLGSWSFAAWKPQEKQLILARDALGFNSLYYHLSPGGITFADRMPSLLAHADTRRHLNMAALAQLSYGTKRDTSSFYKNIHKVPPASLLIFNEGTTPRRHRYWDPGEVPDIRLRSDDEYREAFLETYRTAVASKLHGEGPFGITLSGGLDSGSTAALAVPMLAARGQRLKAFTWTPGGETPDVKNDRTPDEWANVQRLAAFTGGIDVTRVSGFPTSPLKALRTMLDITEEPGNALAGWSWYYGVLQQAGQSGIKTLLTGEAGNFTVSLDHMERRRSFWRRHYRRMRERIKAHRRGDQAHARMLIRPDFAQRILEASPPADPELHDKWKTAPQPMRSAYNIMQSGGLTVSREIAGHFGVDLQIPAMDRRLFEFCYGIPPEQYARGGEGRLLIRHAFAGLMPHEQLWDKKRGLLAGNMNQILSGSRDEIMEIIENARSSPIASEALDLDWIERSANTICSNGESRGLLNGKIVLRGLTYAMFLERFSDTDTGAE
nr:asparagine synthase-related protein [Sphingopyxis sp. BSNA05]